jgi:hypothetical protein
VLCQAPDSQRNCVPARQAVAPGASQLATLAPAAADCSFTGEEPHPATSSNAAIEE